MPLDVGMAGPAIPRQFMTPPTITSGTPVTNSSGINQILYVTVTVNPTLLVAAVFNAQLTDTDGVIKPIAAAGVPAGGVSLAGLQIPLTLQYPAGWTLKCTWSNCSITLLSSIV